jgi:hypothetical protein
MTRRSLLHGLVFSLWSGAAEAAQRLTGRLRAPGVGLVRRANEPTSETLRLSAGELESLLGFGEVLVEGRTLSALERHYLAEHIEDSARHTPDQLVQYRRAVRLLDRLAGKPFSSLEITDRVQLLSRHRLAARAVTPGEDREAFAGEARMIRARVIPDLIEGYWASPAGWTAVGYEAFPGRCGNLTRYTRSEA